MKKILLIHTGGTFGMVPSHPNKILKPGSFQNEVLTRVPELQKLAAIDVAIPFNLDSSDIAGEEWDILGRLIFENLDDYDGFVVIHGTDTMVYTAAALSFSLSNLPKPVVLTGSQRPLSKLRSDARFNLIDAVELATMEIPEVMIVFGGHVLRGNRAKKISVTRYEAFDTPNFPHLGEIGLHIEIKKQHLQSPDKSMAFFPGFRQQVAVISAQPGFAPDYHIPLLHSDLKAFILLGFGSGNLPARSFDWTPFVKEATQNGKPVFIGSHSPHGRIDLNLYECARRAMEVGAVGLGEMTYEAAYVKLQKILVKSTKMDDIIALMEQNWAGEK